MGHSDTVLIVDDDPAVTEFVSNVAQNIGFAAHVLNQPAQAPKYAESLRPCLVVLDLVMPNFDGVQVLQHLAELKCDADIVLLSGADSRVLNAAARIGSTHGLNIRAVLRKPVEVEDLEAALGRPKNSRMKIAADELRSALLRGEIIAAYQPKISLKSDRQWAVDGIEALARWDHPQKGLILPGDFIPVAEDAGVIGDLTNAIFEQALAIAAQLRRQGAVLDLAINISGQTLSSPTLPDQLAQRMAKTGLEPDRLILEITESAAMADTVVVMANMTRFRLKGMKLSLDDFGTGYSSLVQLYRMPFSELKIDRSFVQELETNAESRVIVRSLVDLAHNLGLRAVAEGVETDGALAFLRSVGCDQAQGYLVAPPLSGPDLLTFVARHSDHAAATLNSVVELQPSRPRAVRT